MTAKRFPVELTHVLMFARAIGDPNPAFAAASGPDGAIVAPPTFPMAAAQFDPDNPLIPRPGERWFGSASGPGHQREGGASGRLHAEQIFEYARPVRVGDVLTGTARPGRTWQKESKRGGTLNFEETVTDYHDQHDELVVSVTMVAVITEKPVEQESRDET